ncbi:MAG: CPBP family intramembrane metalloprotease [Roseburia sp.]|nr:CPBP family intramembrane metalloprotease [Roseburia sp.]
MKMNFNLETPTVVAEAREAKRGWNWFVELLVFVLMFIVVTIGEVLVMVPIELAVLFTNQDYLDAVAAQDMNKVMEVTTQIASSDILVVGMLFANIAMILLTMLFCKVIQKRKMRTLGFMKKDMFKEYGIGLVVGFAIFTIAVLLCVVTGSLKLGASTNFALGTWVLFGLGYMIQGMAEEVLCRSYLMVSIARRYPMWVAVILNALFFAALHLGNSGISFLAFVNLTLFGVFASVYFIKRGNIWGIGAIHSIWNFVQGNFYGIKVSGMDTTCSAFVSTMTEGRELINGGAFGLEGGLAVTIVLVAGTLFLLTKPAKNVAVEVAEPMAEAPAVEEVVEPTVAEAAQEETAE